MKQWLRQNYVLTYEDINAGRTDWWDRMEARTADYQRVGKFSIPITLALYKCIREEEGAAHLAAIFGLLGSDESWVESTVGDLGLQAPLSAPNGGLGSQIYGGIWDDLDDALTTDGASGALALKGELVSLAGVAEAHAVGFAAAVIGHRATPTPEAITNYLTRNYINPEHAGRFCATVLLARLNRVKHWLAEAASEEPATTALQAALRKRCQSNLGMLKQIEGDLVAGRPIGGGAETALFMGIPCWDSAYYYAEQVEDAPPAYVDL